MTTERPDDINKLVNAAIRRWVTRPDLQMVQLIERLWESLEPKQEDKNDEHQERQRT
ncbi:MAG: hypothetical protein ACUVX9_15035 [Anaerolineae bacterium]